MTRSAFVLSLGWLGACSHPGPEADSGNGGGLPDCGGTVVATTWDADVDGAPLQDALVSLSGDVLGLWDTDGVEVGVTTSVVPDGDPIRHDRSECADGSGGDIYEGPVVVTLTTDDGAWTEVQFEGTLNLNSGVAQVHSYAAAEVVDGARACPSGATWDRVRAILHPFTAPLAGSVVCEGTRDGNRSGVTAVDPSEEAVVLRIAGG